MNSYVIELNETKQSDNDNYLIYNHIKHNTLISLVIISLKVILVIYYAWWTNATKSQRKGWKYINR